MDSLHKEIKKKSLTEDKRNDEVHSPEPQKAHLVGEFVVPFGI